MAADDKLKMTIYIPVQLVHELDALKVEDQQEPRRTGVTLNTSRPEYVVWALGQFAEGRRSVQARGPKGRSRKA